MLYQWVSIPVHRVIRLDSSGPEVSSRLETVFSRTPIWHDRPEQFSSGEAANGKLDGHHFIQMADQFISLANKRNRKVDATEIQMVMLFAAARYAAHVGKNVIELPEQEEFIKHMAGQYADMLRGHLADPNV